MKEKMNKNNLIADILYIIAGTIMMVINLLDGSYVMTGIGAVMMVSGIVITFKIYNQKGK